MFDVIGYLFLPLNYPPTIWLTQVSQISRQEHYHCIKLEWLSFQLSCGFTTNMPFVTNVLINSWSQRRRGRIAASTLRFQPLESLMASHKTGPRSIPSSGLVNRPRTRLPSVPPRNVLWRVMGRVIHRETSQVPVYLKLAIADYPSNRSHSGITM